MKKTSARSNFIVVLIPLIFFCLFGVTNKAGATVMTASQVLMSPYTCPSVNFGTHAVTVIVSTNSNYNPNATFNTVSDCSAYTAAAINKYNNGITCGNTVFVGSFQWNPLFSTAPSPVPGVCGSSNNTSSLTAPIYNLCSAGSASAVSTNSSTFTWSCYGSSGGSTASCTAIRLLPVNGKCGTTNNSCAPGTSVDVTDTSTQYKWNCNGSNGGTSAACAINKPVNAVCSLTTSHVCTTGTLGDTSDTSTQYKWSCIGLNGGTGASCTLNKPVTGICGSTNNSCNAGTFVDVTDTSTQYLWSCNGSGTGSNASCQINKISAYNCSPSNTTANVGDTIVWTASGVSGGTSPYNYIWSEIANISNSVTTNIPSFNRVYVLSDVGTKSEYLQVVDSFGMSAAFKLCSSNVTVNNFCIGPDGSNIPNGIKKSYWSNSSSPNCDQIREDLTCNNGTLTDQFGKTGSFSTFTSTSCSYSSLPVKVSLFKISPNTINSGGACKPTWTLSLTDNHSVCELYRQPVANFIYKNSYTGTYPITESFLDNGITNETTYKLFCYELQNDGSKTNSTTSYSTCYINPTTKERS